MQAMFLYYKESRDGQILEEGITEAGGHVIDDRGRHSRTINYGHRDDPVLHAITRCSDFNV